MFGKNKQKLQSVELNDRDLFKTPLEPLDERVVSGNKLVGIDGMDTVIGIAKKDIPPKTVIGNHYYRIETDAKGVRTYKDIPQWKHGGLEYNVFFEEARDKTGLRHVEMNAETSKRYSDIVDSLTGLSKDGVQGQISCDLYNLVSDDEVRRHCDTATKLVCAINDLNYHTWLFKSGGLKMVKVLMLVVSYFMCLLGILSVVTIPFDATLSPVFFTSFLIALFQLVVMQGVRNYVATELSDLMVTSCELVTNDIEIKDNVELEHVVFQRECHFFNGLPNIMKYKYRIVNEDGTKSDIEEAPFLFPRDSFGFVNIVGYGVMYAPILRLGKSTLHTKDVKLCLCGDGRKYLVPKEFAMTLDEFVEAYREVTSDLDQTK